MRTRNLLRWAVILAALPVFVATHFDGVAQRADERSGFKSFENWSALGSRRADESPRGWLGVFVTDVEAAEGAESLDPGVLVQGIVIDSPADRAGLRASDIITHVDGRPVISSGDLISRLGAVRPGTSLAFSIERRGRSREVLARLEERPPERRRLEMRRGWIGAAAIDLPDPLRQYLGAPEGSGVMISDLVDFGPAVNAGLELGDVLFEIEGKAVESVRHFQEFVEGGGVGNAVAVKVMRRDLEIALDILIEEKPEEAGDPRRTE